MSDDIDEIVLTREGIADLIRNEYDKAPDYWLAREKWDDGAERIADTLLAAIERLRDEAAINETVIHGLRANRDDAEAEIERLKADLHRRTALDEVSAGAWAADVKRLKARAEAAEAELAKLKGEK